MHPSLTKARIFATIALLILTFAFTLPMIAFNGALTQIDEGKGDEISPLTAKVWNFYNQGRYKSIATPKEARNNLEQMIVSASEVGPASLPLWSVSLEAPNYPKEAFPDGIPVFFHFEGYSGEVHEMNVINHYVGMDPMWIGGTIEREYGLYALLLLSLSMVYFIAYNHKVLNYLMLIPATIPFIFIADYSAWLYWFGHNLHDWGAFKIKPFMPTVFGDGKIAQFTTHSYPDIGFYLLLVIAVLCVLAFFAKEKAMKEMSV